MLVKIVIIGLLLAIIAALMSSMLFLVRDDSGRKRTLTGLKIRVALSVTLIVFVLISYHFGWLRPHGVLPQPPAVTAPEGATPGP